jgi:hypothetical protein
MNITGGTDPKVDELLNELQRSKEERLNQENNKEILPQESKILKG